MTERSVAVRGLLCARTDGIPPPTPLVAHNHNQGVESAASTDHGASPSTRPDQSRQNTGAEPGTHIPAHGDAVFGLDNLLRDPVSACRAMSQYRENMPARALNVDLTPVVARRFDDQCHTLRIKKKDVIELLLRGWLAHLGHESFDADR